MSVNSSGIPLFAGLEDVDDMFMATMEEMDSEIVDELNFSHPLWEYLQRHNLVEKRSEIGTHVPVHLRKEKNQTVQWHTGYEDAKSIPADVLAEARYAYGHLTARQMYNREELVKNSGKQQLIDMVEAKQEQALSDVNEEFATTIIGTQDADGRKPMGIGRIMDDSQAIGGVPLTGATSFYKPQVIYKTGTTKFTLSSEFREGMRKTMRSVTTTGGGKVLGKGGKSAEGIKPDVQICGEDVYEEMQKWAEGKLQVRMDEIKDASGWGDFEMFNIQGRTVIYEPALNAKDAWFCNFKKSIRVRVHTKTFFTWMPWAFLDNKVQVKYRDNLTYVCVYCKSRRANALLSYQ